MICSTCDINDVDYTLVFEGFDTDVLGKSPHKTEICRWCLIDLTSSLKADNIRYNILKNGKKLTNEEVNNIITELMEPKEEEVKHE